MNCKLLLPLVVACWVMPRLSPASDEYFDSKGVKIRYVTEGSGEPVVLIHGWMSDSTMWGRDASGNTKLSGLPGFQIVALDCRGHGKSDKPHEKEKYGAEMAEDVVRLLDHLKISKAHLIGYSMGAYIAANVAATHPDRVRSVIFGGQSPLLLGRSWTDSSEITVFAAAVDAGKGLGPYLVEVSPADKKPTLEQANAYAKMIYQGKDVKAWACAGLSFRDLRVRGEDLKKCTAPMLFIYGSQEPNSTKDAVERVRKLLNRGELKVIQGTNHMTTLINPEFGKSIVAFLQANKGK